MQDCGNSISNALELLGFALSHWSDLYSAHLIIMLHMISYFRMMLWRDTDY